MLRGLAELFNDLSEKTGSHDIVRLHRLILQMNRALGMFEAQKQTLAAGVPGAIFRCAGDQMGDAGRARRAAISGFTAGIRVSDQLERLLWRSIPHIIITRDLTFAEQFFAFAGDERG